MIDRVKLAGVAAIAAAALWAAPASAQATRTWVSGVGDDMNPCSRTAPCKTFDGAISKTAAGGEINCLDPGGFGGVTITKSIAIMCDGVTGGVLVSGANGITVNAGENDRVMLSGLDIHGTGTGVIGVRVVRARTVTVRKSTIQGFVADSVITSNTTGISGAVASAGDNLVYGNASDGSFTSAIKPK